MLLKSRGYQVCQRALSAICFKVSICFARASRSFGDNCEVVFGASDTAKNTQELRSHIAAEILSFNGGQNGRNIKHFGSFCQSNCVVDQQLAIDGDNAKSHLRLLVYKNDG
jgi:hypothetical protein